VLYAFIALLLHTRDLLAKHRHFFMLRTLAIKHFSALFDKLVKTGSVHSDFLENSLKLIQWFRHEIVFSLQNRQHILKLIAPHLDRSDVHIVFHFLFDPVLL